MKPRCCGFWNLLLFGRTYLQFFALYVRDLPWNFHKIEPEKGDHCHYLVVNSAPQQNSLATDSMRENHTPLRVLLL